MERVHRILHDAGNEKASGYPRGFTHFGLAKRVYGVEDPTPAQLSAVRRAVARLVKAGRAARDDDARWSGNAGVEYSGSHWRTNRHGLIYTASNPAGVLIRRWPWTPADREARAMVVERWRKEWGEEVRRGGSDY